MTDSATAKVARDLTEIEKLAADLDDQAGHHASDRLMPGGLANAAAAPVASPSIWAAQLDTLERSAIAYAHENGIDSADIWPEIADDDSWEPPLQTLLFWSEEWRVIHGYPLTDEHGKPRRPTLATEAAFIRWAIDWAWDNEPRFADFATDINRARLRLESTLYAGRRVERTRIHCDRGPCETKPLLIKVHGPERIVGYKCRACGTSGIVSPDATHCTNPFCWTPVAPEPVIGSDKDEDFHKCPGCKARFNADEFGEALARQLRSESAERFVRLSVAIDILRSQGRGERTVWRWLAPPIEHVEDSCTECGRTWPPQEYPACPRCDGELEPVTKGDGEQVIESYCDVATHRVWVWWPDMWRRHHATRRTPRVA